MPRLIPFMVTNAFGSVTSQVVRLVVPDPFITVQPASIAALPGQTAFFSITAGRHPALELSMAA